MTQHLRGWVPVILCLVPVLNGGCSKTQQDDLRELVPDMSEEIAQHLAEDSQDAFRRYTAEAGLEAVIRTYHQLKLAPTTDSLAVFVKQESQLAPFVEKLKDALAVNFKIPPINKLDWAYKNRPAADRLEIVRLSCRQRDLAYDTAMSIEEKATAYLDLIDRSLPYADAINMGILYATYANFLPRLGKRELMPTYLNRGVEAAVRHEDFDTAGLILGTLGVYYSGEKDYERMRACWNRGLQLARQGQSWHEARILSFYATHYLKQGRLVLSREMLREAQDRARALDAIAVEPRFLTQGLLFFCDLEAWPVVAREIDRAEMVLKRCEGRLESDDMKHWAEQVDKYRAIYWSANGNCSKAESLSSSVITRMDRRPPSYAIASSQIQMAQVLSRCGSLEQARAILDGGARRWRQEGLHDILQEVELARADVCFLLQDYQGCRAALDSSRLEIDQWPSGTHARDAIQHDVLSIKLALATGDQPLALQTLRQALERLDRRWRDLERSAEGSLALTAAAAELGDLAHQLLYVSAESGYAQEMAWRLNRAGTTTGSTVSENLAQLEIRNAAHCVFRVQGDRVLRWTAYDGRVVRDEVSIAAEDLTRRVLSFRRSVFLDPSGGKADPKRGYDLATDLLPTDLLNSEPSAIFITPDGPLEQLPFEALNLSPCGYVPVLSRMDVAYVVLARRPLPAANESVVVVADPAYPAELKRRYSILTEALPAGVHEASAFASQFGRIVPLSGKQASKRSLLELWEKAGALYFACHTLRDPEIPYLTFIPMAEDPSEPGERLYLDVKDVRTADLSGCKLVVLSSCETGTGYLTRRVSVPSLAQAFVEAGAQAVISTSWNVRDDVAAEVMHAFAKTYAETPKSPVVALNQARRGLLEKGKPASVWASYTILLGGFWEDGASRDPSRAGGSRFPAVQNGKSAGM